MNFDVRLAAESDAQAISDIYNHYVDCSTCTFDLKRESLADRLDWLAEHGERYPVTVCVTDGQVVGWASLTRWSPRAAYDRTAEVSFYVHHQWHRRGIGRLLLADLIARARRIGHHVLLGGACTEQTASIKLQQSFGFTQVACLREVGYKFNRWLDVAYLQLSLAGLSCNSR